MGQNLVSPPDPTPDLEVDPNDPTTDLVTDEVASDHQVLVASLDEARGALNTARAALDAATRAMNIAEQRAERMRRTQVATEVAFSS